MIDAIGSLRLALPGPPDQAHRARSAASVAKAAALGPGQPLDQGDGARVLLVRRLSLRIPLPRADGPETLASAAGRSLEPALRKALARPPRDLDLVTFESVAEYLAHFVEQCVHQRPIDAWYFYPLSAFVAPTLGETLQRLADAEPEAWPAVLALLRARGLFPVLLQRLPADGQSVLFGASYPSRRRLGLYEARPLFATAWRIMAALLDLAKADGPVRLPGLVSAASAGAMDVGSALQRFLATNPEAPRTWADPGALGTIVAAMVDWLIEQCPPGPRNHAGAESALSACRWLDPTPIRVVLSQSTRPRAVAASAPALVPAGNRTQALQYLEAAVSSDAGEGREAFDPLLTDVLRRRGLYQVEAIERLLVGPAVDLVLPPPSGGALQRLRAAVRFLTRDEVRTLAKALARTTGVSADPEVSTGAAGIFLLIRPLVDLRLPLGQSEDLDLTRGIVREVGLLAGGPDENVAATVLATGRLPDGREPAAAGSAPIEKYEILRAHLLARGASLRLDPADEAASVPAIALALCCRQLVRWLSGFERSSMDYVLEKIVRRPGHFRVPAKGSVSVVWPGSGFDIVLDRAGYLDPLTSVPWWDGRGLIWQR